MKHGRLRRRPRNIILNVLLLLNRLASGVLETVFVDPQFLLQDLLAAVDFLLSTLVLLAISNAGLQRKRRGELEV